MSLKPRELKLKRQVAKYVHYLPGGGLGDVFREAYFHNALGVLKRFKLENPRDELKLLLMGHNPAIPDLFLGQEWIDELRFMPFPEGDIGDWSTCYKEYQPEFEGYTELRFNIPDSRSNYRSDLSILRPRHRNMKTIQAVGMSWDFYLTREEQHEVDSVLHQGERGVFYHPGAGDFIRTISEDLDEWLTERFGDKWIRIGAKYVGRATHSDEAGVTLAPRVLIAALRKARAVVGTESSVYYLASMLDVPTLMFYREGQAFANWQHKNDSTWNWFFNTKDPRSAFVRMPPHRRTKTTD
jgi:hypothetical protein